LGGNWSAALGAMAPLFLFFIGFILFVLVIWIAGIRVMTVGKIAVTFHKNRKKTGGLLREDRANNCVWLKSKNDPKGEKYDIDEDMIEDLDWPGGFPSFLQTTLRSLEYVKGVHTPYRAEKHTSNTTARTNKLVTDENVMNAVYHYAERSLGLQKTKQSMIMLICMTAILGVSLFSLYLGMQTRNDVAATKIHIQQTFPMSEVK